jgi:Fe-S-cluster containining protein
MPTPPRTECLRCGCCCFASEPGYIGVHAVDLERMGPQARELTSVVGVAGEHRAMRFEAGRCAALRHDPNARCCACAIHAERPDACRWLTPGSGFWRARRGRTMGR